MNFSATFITSKPGLRKLYCIAGRSVDVVVDGRPQGLPLPKAHEYNEIHV